MPPINRPFQIFAKPAGAVCNLNCRYCYYLDKGQLQPDVYTSGMPEILLEEYIVQHIEACSEREIRFSWHGGEPTVLGLNYFRRIVEIQSRYGPAGRILRNGIQTNGILIDDAWGRFLSSAGFFVGLSLDGPQELHDRCRRTKGDRGSYKEAVRGYEILKRHSVSTEILCVVSAHNVTAPLDVYRRFRDMGTAFISFLPLVERSGDTDNGLSRDTVPAAAWGDFLITVFDEWLDKDIGRIKVQIFEEAARTAFDQEHSLCIFRPVCGDIPVVEKNGDFYACDHYVDEAHLFGNIIESSLDELLDSPEQRAFGRKKLDTLPDQCLDCEVRAMCNGGCPKNRFIRTPGGEEGLNYLCSGYRRFFNHCRPFLEAVTEAWKEGPFT